MGIYQRLYKAIKEHSGMDDEQIIEAANHGADSGWPGFCYTTDCMEFFQANAGDVWTLAAEVAEEIGNITVTEMISGFGRSDMLDDWERFQNRMAWFTLETVGHWLENNPQEGDEEEDFGGPSPEEME